jgi:hypothetical protein
MVYDKNIAKLFLLNFNEAYRSAKLLMLSYKRVANLIPINAEFLQKNINEDDMDKLDAFRVRYCDLQDNLGNKTFRTILNLEEEQTGSNLDILNKMAKRGIITFEEWKELRNIRNLFSHDYPETDEEKAEMLNIAYSGTLKLVKTVDNVIDYMEKKINFSMEHFPLLLQNKDEI